jgi:hypothetical protein
VESLQTGDRVLCQDLDSQKLQYRVVLNPTRRPATPTFNIVLPDDRIQASGGHLFWIVGRGWMRTRDLRAGMTLRTADRSALPIRDVAAGGSLPLYNLVVDRHANYFVGTGKVLSHDSTILGRGEPSVEDAGHP